MADQVIQNRGTGKTGRWSLAGAVFAALAASICCVGPLVLQALGVGGAWASRLSALEPYRPVLIGATLAFLSFAFYRAYRTPTACAANGSCTAGSASKFNRAVLWLATPFIIALLALPYFAPRLVARQTGDQSRHGNADSAGCCAVNTANTLTASSTNPAAMATNQHEQPDAAREIVFKVDKLGCPLVNGVGCGHLLAPTLARLSTIDGASASFANWTGELIRVSIQANADRDAVAARVQAVLAEDQQAPARLKGDELTGALNKEDWRGVDRISELTSYEFSTVAKRRVNAFADAEQLDQPKRERLLRLVDELWDTSGQGLGHPKPESEAYARYWRNRRDQFIAAYIERVRAVLSTEQVEKLAKEYAARPK